MIKKYALLLLLLIAIARNATAENLRQREMISEIYQYTLTDFKRAQMLMNRLRQQHVLSAHELNLIEGDLYFNRSDYFLALNFYKRALYDKSISDSIHWQQDLMERLIPCYNAIGDMKNVEFYSLRLEQLAKETDDMPKQIMATFWLGRVAYANGHRAQAYKRMHRAIRRLKDSDMKGKNQLLFYYQMALIEYLQKDGRDREGLAALKHLESWGDTARKTSDRQEPLLTPQMQKDIYAHQAVLAHRIGRIREAREAYEQFKTTGNDYQYDYKCIAPYLEANALYDDMTRFAQARINYLRQVSVTCTSEMTAALYMLADGYVGKGYYQQATENYKRLSALKRDIIGKAEKSAMTELTSVYKLKEMELQLQARMNWERIISVAAIALTVVLSLCYVSYRTIRFSRKVVRKNQLIIRMLDELTQKKQQLQDEVQEDKKESADADQDRQTFNRIRKELIEGKLYLRADLNRDVLLQKFHIPKNKFSSLFTQYAGMSYSQFINGLRLDHATRMLRSHPHYTVDSIAGECGMTTTTFYRLFSQRYGMTPAEYRKAMLSNLREEPEADDDEDA